MKNESMNNENKIVKILCSVEFILHTMLYILYTLNLEVKNEQIW